MPISRCGGRRIPRSIRHFMKIIPLSLLIFLLLNAPRAFACEQSAMGSNGWEARVEGCYADAQAAAAACQQHLAAHSAEASSGCAVASNGELIIPSWPAQTTFAVYNANALGPPFHWYVFIFDGVGSPPDGDGDGIPDSEDPCPDNPDTGCIAPGVPPAKPALPDSIDLGDCTLDISSLNAWLASPDSFPFNFLYFAYGVLKPLFDAEPAAPVFEFDLTLDPHSQYSWIPDTCHMKIDFAFLDGIALAARQVEASAIFVAFAYYGLKRYRSFAGV